MAGSKIFTIGTFRRTTKTLEQQAKKWGGNGTGVIAVLNECKHWIEGEDRGRALDLLYNLRLHIQQIDAYLQQAETDIGNEEWLDAMTDVDNAIAEFESIQP